uniref:P-type domain-containing protein n=1 Tax=Kryptolebias marmoratus TaxID=37003 RepID=A0A3Q3BRX2_KRYMA
MKVVLPPGPISEIVLKGVYIFVSCDTHLICLAGSGCSSLGGGVIYHFNLLKSCICSEYRLPCGSSSISQTECLSMGCCFNKHPPACYYPMDGELHSVALLAFSRHLAKCS